MVGHCRLAGDKPWPLPADRDEFNDDDASLLPLPSHVAFVPLNDTKHWSLWQAWVYDTWTTFQLRVNQAVYEAQRSKDFRGVIYFQLPSWYSLPSSSLTPLTYTYVDAMGQRVEKTEQMSAYVEYDRLNQVVMGTDMDRMLASPYLAGVIHESTCSIHQRPSGDPSDPQWDMAVEASDRYVHFYVAQGQLLQRACHNANKIFGAFARSQYFKDRKVLTPEGFAAGWNHTLSVFPPHIVATIGLSWLIDPQRLSPRYAAVLPGMTGELAAEWRRLAAN